nr:MAG TPA: hypothetical protein [Inoviridae sp.]
MTNLPSVQAVFLFFCGHRFTAGLASFGLRTKVATLVSANPLSLRSFFAAHSVCSH